MMIFGLIPYTRDSPSLLKQMNGEKITPKSFQSFASSKESTLVPFSAAIIAKSGIFLKAL
jgi:hypothetical protein